MSLTLKIERYWWFCLVLGFGFISIPYWKNGSNEVYVSSAFNMMVIILGIVLSVLGCVLALNLWRGPSPVRLYERGFCDGYEGAPLSDDSEIYKEGWQDGFRDRSK